MGQVKRLRTSKSECREERNITIGFQKSCARYLNNQEDKSLSASRKSQPKTSAVLALEKIRPRKYPMLMPDVNREFPQISAAKEEIPSYTNRINYPPKLSSTRSSSSSSSSSSRLPLHRPRSCRSLNKRIVRPLPPGHPLPRLLPLEEPIQVQTNTMHDIKGEALIPNLTVLAVVHDIAILSR